MEKSRKIVLAVFSLFVLYAIVSASALVNDIVSPMTSTICKIYSVMKGAAGGLAALVITMAGFKWVGSAEDPGARKQAKDTIIHALIGMLLISVATDIVFLITASTGCTA